MFARVVKKPGKEAASPNAAKQQERPRGADHCQEPHALEGAPLDPRFQWSFTKMPFHPPGREPSSQPLPLQRKLAVGSVNDPLEQEADRVADQVMRMPEPQIAPAAATPPVSRKCASCEPEEEDKLQRKEAAPPTAAMSEAPASVHEALRSPGQPLDATLQQEMAQRFGHDFSKVRVHLGAAAERSAYEVHANAYTVGKNIVFGAGQFAPDADEGRRLLAHELMHVVQQGGIAEAVQREPKSKADQEREAAIEKARMEGVLCTSAQSEGQWDAEKALRLNQRKPADKNYALSLGFKDKGLIQKRHAVSPKLLFEIATKVRFFRGEAKAAYLQLVGGAVIEFGGSDAGSAILEPCASEAPREAEEGAVEQATPPWATPKVSCDPVQHEYEIESEDDPASSRCMDTRTDPEYTRNYFDENIASAAGFSVPETTWQNVTYDRFKVMLVTYKNGKSEFFVLNDVGDFHSGALTQMSMLPTKYVKRTTTGLVYPLDRGQIYLLSEHLTPHIISLKNGLKYQVKDLQSLYNLLQIGGTFASIMSLYAVGVESFKTSISAFQRTGPARLPGRPLPGIGVKRSGTTTSVEGGATVRAPGQEGVFKEGGEPEEGAFKGEKSGESGQEGGAGSKRTTTIEEEQSGGERTPTSGGGSAEYKPLSKNPDIGVMEVRDDGSVSIVSANRGDELRPGEKVGTHINLANDGQKGLGPVTPGAARYRLYMQNGKVYRVEPLSRSQQTPQRVGEIQRALQRNRLVLDAGTTIDLDPRGQNDTLKKIVLPR